MNQNLPPTVCLDGAAVRRIREEKKLTQLYVAKVVGVTTDTISRWENNRYPSIKRENALRLAEALEASVGDILQGGTGECAVPVEEPPPPPSRFRRLLPLLFLVLMLLAAGSYFYWRHRLAPGNALKAERVLPNFAAPGSIIPVQVRLEAEAGSMGFILREHFPRGWKMLESFPPAASLDNEEGTARWIVKPDEQRPMISYLLRVDESASLGGEGVFSGEVIATPDGRDAPSAVGGAVKVGIAAYQWADLDGDGVIDDAEMLQASDTVDKMKGVHLDWKELEDLWDAGGYRWDRERDRFVPVRPVHPPAAPAH